MDLCMNKKVRESFDRLSTQQKSAFTRVYNQGHKDPLANKKTKGGKAAPKAGADEDEISSDEELDKNGALDEDEIAEIKKAKQKERDRLQKAKENKIGEDQLAKIKANLFGESDMKGDLKGKAKGKGAKT